MPEFMPAGGSAADSKVDRRPLHALLRAEGEAVLAFEVLLPNVADSIVVRLNEELYRLDVRAEIARPYTLREPCLENAGPTSLPACPCNGTYPRGFRSDP
jgi:hypothetical protein